MDKPLPCPFCGDKKLFISREVYCEKCGCYGPEAMNEEYAIKFWNERFNNTQEPKTPTKEQILKIMYNAPQEFDGVFWCDGLSSYIAFVITEWEKIRMGTGEEIE